MKVQNQNVFTRYFTLLNPTPGQKHVLFLHAFLIEVILEIGPGGLFLQNNMNGAVMEITKRLSNNKKSA